MSFSYDKSPFWTAQGLSHFLYDLVMKVIKRSLKDAAPIVCLLCVLFWETERDDFHENRTETSFWIN